MCGHAYIMFARAQVCVCMFVQAFVYMYVFVCFEYMYA